MKRVQQANRLLLPLFLIAFLLSGTANSQAQTATGKRVNINVKSAPAEDVFMQIKKQSGLDIVYASSIAREWPKVTVRIANKTAIEAVDQVTKLIGCSYEQNGNIITITRQKASGRERKIRGYVKDSSGNPLVGVPICIGETRVCTVTDESGFYSFSIPVEKTILKYSYVGMETVYETIPEGDTEKNVSIIMRSDTQLTEVVVTGYQVINKRELTSAVTTVKAEDVFRPDAMSIDQMLEGRVPDLMVTSNSGEAGVVPKIRIRGTSSLISNREPLWVVDGIVVQDPVQISPEELNDPDYVNRIGNAIAGLNPQDIERLDILKDASATALYGSKAANGVIVITTKRGHEGKTQVRYNNNFTMKLRPRYTDRSVNVMNSLERMQFSRELIDLGYKYNNNIAHVGYEGALQDLYSGRYSFDDFQQQVAQLETINTDWFSLLTHDSFSQQHTVSLTGGNKQHKYYASIGLVDNDDVVNNTKNRRYTATVNFDTELARWLSASFSMKGNVSERDYYQSSLSPVEYAYTASRTIPAYISDGEDYYYYRRMVSSSTGYNYNILNELENSSVEQQANAVTLDANFRIKLASWLSGNLIGSYTSQTTDIDSYWGENTYYAARLRGSEFGVTAPAESLMPQGGELATSHYRQNYYTLRAQMDVNKFLGPEDRHNISGSIGYEMSSTRYRGHQATNRGYYPSRGKSFVTGIDQTYYSSYAGWLMNNVPTITDDLNNSASFYASATYGYDRMVYVNANMRVDGSNKFGSESNHKFLPVWSVSGSFNLAKLPGLKDLRWMDFLTLKGSYGFQGNMIKTEYPILVIQKGPLNAFYGEYTSTAFNNPNPNLRWERTNSSNIGFETSFLDNRIQLEGSLYFKRTHDAYMNKTISTVNGLSSYVVNGGDISNDGYSLAITTVPLRSKDWTWTLATSFSHTSNEVTSHPDGETYELSDFLNGTAIVRGKSVSTFYSYKFLGLSPVDGGPMFDDWEDHSEDLIGLSKYDTYTAVLEASGLREPTISGSITSMLRYRQFRLNLAMAYSLGAKTRLFGMFGNGTTATNGSRVNDAGDIRPEWNASRDYFDRWRQSGDELFTRIPAIISEGSPSYYKYISHWSQAFTDDGIQTLATSYWDMYDFSNQRVVSADYLKCSTLSLTYTLPANWLKSLSLQRLEISVTGNNLFTICSSRLKGQTPSQGGFSTIQLSDRPSFSVGMNIIF